MVSFRFPFSFSQPPKPKSPNAANSNFSKRSFSDNFAVGTVSVSGVGAGIAAGIVLSQISSKPFVENPLNFLLSSLNRNHFSPAWGSLTLADSSAPVTESRTGMSFPSVLKDSQRLLGTGVRRKAILGLKNIDVYAFGTAFNLLMFFFSRFSSLSFLWAFVFDLCLFSKNCAEINCEFEIVFSLVKIIPYPWKLLSWFFVFLKIFTDLVFWIWVSIFKWSRLRFSPNLEIGISFTVKCNNILVEHIKR